MKVLIKNAMIGFCVVAVFISQNVHAQDSCYNCNIDSLTQLMENAKTDPERVRLLTMLIDLRLLGSNIKHNNHVEMIDYFSIPYLTKLIELSKSEKVKNIEAYKSLFEASSFFAKKDYINAQNSMKKSIELFDQVHKKIPYLVLFTRISYNLAGNQEDRLKFYTEKLNYYLKTGPIENVAACYHALGGYYVYKADYNLAISNYLKAAAIFKNFDDKSYRNDLYVVGSFYAIWGNFQKSMEYIHQAIPLDIAAADSVNLCNIYVDLSEMHRRLNKYEEAIHYADSAMVYLKNRNGIIRSKAILEKAFSYISLKQFKEGYSYLNLAKSNSDSTIAEIYSAAGAFELDYGYYQYCLGNKNYAEAGKYLVTAYEKSVKVKSNELQLKYLRELSLFFGQQGNATLAYNYNRKFFELTDELEKSTIKVAQYENEEKEIKQNDNINLLKQQSAIQAATIKKNNTILWGSLVAIVLISISLFFVYRQYRMNRRTLLSLRKTQRQLVMSEKMASLGELTAGIAHEIQNPLNFVNNFSEVSNELIDEMNEELDKGETDAAKAIAVDIKQNLEKINHHGKRADAIVKGMLQHSRSSSGVKEPTNLNALSDEYLRLAYHGLRAKDKSFNSTMKTDFDESIGNINIIPQDIGRVILNLITNAFYAVTEKKKKLLTGYEPTVSVSTKRQGDRVLISVKDNGDGIPQKVLDKIFQPFFTTKPTGEGTGLGLSMSYDIVRAHGGELKVETKEGEGTVFTFSLISQS